MGMLCVWLGMYGVFSLVVISMVYAAYPNGCQRECTSLSRLRPDPVPGIGSCGGICVHMISCTFAAFCESSSHVLWKCTTEQDCLTSQK